jgi:hypothetical protein
VNVLIYETETGVPVATVVVPTQRQCYKPSECYERAWEVAVCGDLVDPSHREIYGFRVLRAE